MTPPRRNLLGIVVPLVALLGVARAEPAYSSVPGASKDGEILITAALVDQDMKVRPVPLHGIFIRSSAGDTISVRTGLDGKVAVSAPAGTYTVASSAPTVFQGHSYTWVLSVAVTPGRTVELALTNDNAAISPSSPSPGQTRVGDRLDTAADLYNRFNTSVFRIQAGLAHGTGFLADTLGGVIITNAHVVENSEASEISAVLDSHTRTRAQLLSRDPDADIAILRVSPDDLTPETGQI